MRIRLIFIIGISLVLAILYSIYASSVRIRILDKREELACPAHSLTCTVLPVDFSNSSKETQERVLALSKKREVSKYGRRQPGHFEIGPTSYGYYTLSFLETTERLSYEYAKIGNLKKAKEMIEEMNASYTNSLFLDRLKLADAYYKSPSRYRQITEKFNVKDIPLILNILKEDYSYDNKHNFIEALFALSIAKYKQGDVSFAHDVAKIMEAISQVNRYGHYRHDVNFKRFLSKHLKQFLGIYILIDDKDKLFSILEKFPQKVKNRHIQEGLKKKDPSMFLESYRGNYYGPACGTNGDVIRICAEKYLTFKEYALDKNVTVNNYMQYLKDTCVQSYMDGSNKGQLLSKKSKRRITNRCIKNSKRDIEDILYDVATSKDRKKYFTGYLNLLSMLSNDKHVIPRVKNNFINRAKITISKHLMQPDKYPLFIEELLLPTYMNSRSRSAGKLLYDIGLKDASHKYRSFVHQKNAREKGYSSAYAVTMSYIKYGELDKAEESLLDILEYARFLLRTGYNSNYTFRQDRAYYHLSSFMDNEADIVNILKKVKTPIWHNSIRYTLAEKLINDGQKERATYYLQSVPTYKEEYPDLLKVAIFSLRPLIEFEKDLKPIHERIFVLKKLKSQNKAQQYILYLRGLIEIPRNKDVKDVLLAASYNPLYVQIIKAKEATQKMFQEVFDIFDREINF